MSAINQIILSTQTEQLEKALSPFIREQFPGFARTDYSKLVLFIKAYYEWLEKNGNPSSVTMNLEKATDIDSNIDEFYSHFKSMYLDGFPQIFAENENGDSLNKKTLLKKIREFYGNKGTESAYRFLFNILYDSDLEIYYPSADVFRASDGRWVEPISIKTTSKNGKALFSVKGGNAYQYSGERITASAFVDSVVQYVFNGLPITEFFLKDINGDFLPDAPVVFVKGSSSFTETSYSVLGELFIQTPGYGYGVGGAVTLFDNNGKGFSAKIKQIDLAGGVKKIEIVNSGLNYFASSEGASADFFLLSVFSSEGTKTAKVFGKRSALTRYPGYFSGNKGQVSSNKKIQDGHYYQEFSYELKSRVSIDSYFDVLRSVIHPSGIRMFGSVLVKEFLTNRIRSSTQATYYDDPIIGEYAPYKTNTTINLRDNGVTTEGYWLGATGDLYPLGYNPYIGSTAQVGINGRTTSRGTVFVGGSLGYTWCYVPEDGITSHDPIGAPLGSTASWYSGAEISWTPSFLRGLTLWLRPEMIGVCGSVVNGASVDIWMDSSPSKNDATVPAWGRMLNRVADIVERQQVSSWSRQVYDSTNPVTKISFSPSGLCGGFTAGRLFMLGLNRDPVASASYETLDYAWYSYGNYINTNPSRSLYFFESGMQMGGIVAPSEGTAISYFDNDILEIEYQDPTIIYRRNGETVRTVHAGYGVTFYFDSSFYSAIGVGVTGTSVRIHEVSYHGKPIVPNFVATSGVTATVYGNQKIDKLRPVLQTGSLAGPTGVCFNGGVLYAEMTTWNGVCLSHHINFGNTHGSGSMVERILTGQHLYLKNDLQLPADAEIFVVLRPTVEGYDRGLGLASSVGGLTGFSGDDTVLYHRSYNPVDRNPSLFTSQYYKIMEDGNLMYPSQVPTGLVGFRPSGSLYSDSPTIAYDPHVSGVCFGVAIGHFIRQPDGTIRSLLNASESTNSSLATGRAIASISFPDSENLLVRDGLILFYDGKSVMSRGQIGSAYFKNLFNQYALPWVYGSVTTNNSIGTMNWSQNTSGNLNTENNIIYDIDPWGDANLIWNAQPTDATTSYSADGGWNGPIIDIDPTKTYRFSFWLNRKVWGTGTYYAGAYGYDSALAEVPLIRRNNGQQATNQYFTAFNPSTDALPQNVWQLVCHHIHPAGSGIGADHPDSGYYFLSTGIAGKRTYGNDLVWTPASIRGRFRTYLYYATTNDAIQQWVYPRVDVVDGSEPTVQDILDNKPHKWIDISSSGLTGNLVGESSFSFSNNGTIVFGGGNYMELSPPVVSVPDLSSSSPYQRINRFTFEAWLNPTHSPSDPYSHFFGPDGTKSDQYLLYQPSMQTLELQITDRGDAQLRRILLPNGSVPLNKWSQFVLQIDGKTIRMYVNGMLKHQQTMDDISYIGVWDSTGEEPSSKWTFGVRSPAKYFLVDAGPAYTIPAATSIFKGEISNIRVYDRILSDTEVFLNFRAMRERFGL